MDFAAHIREIDGGQEIQTVAEHCNNVAGRSAQYAASFGASALAQAAGNLHDAGKLCVDFTDYIYQRNNLRRGSIDHCFAGAKFLCRYAEAANSKKAVEVTGFLARVILSHHGLHDWIEEDGTDYFRKRLDKEERYSEIEKNIRVMLPEEELRRLLFAAVPEYGRIRVKILGLGGDKRDQRAFYLGMFDRLMESALVDADRTDTANFQWNVETEAFFDKNLWNQFSEKIELQSELFKRRTDPLSLLRCDISERCRQFAERETGICRMIVPTGGGKTLSSLRFATHYCKKFNKDHIFYIAPFMSILEQNSSVWKSVLGEEYVLEHHSNIRSNISTDEELAQYELRAEKWDQPVIATTLVQFLNAFFSARMDSVRRMHRLCNSVIIIDEVQSIPVKCVHLFNLAVNFISKIGGSCVVLCSATQPVFEKTKYPLLLDEESSMTGSYEGDFRALKRSRIVPLLRQNGYTYEEASHFCREKFAENGSVLFVVNTKDAALKLYQSLTDLEEKGVSVVHLSTNMCPERRKTVIGDIKAKLAQGSPLICVTTQLIEAGVDISFPCVIRSLAGLDNAAQAAGRCNRNGEWNRCCDVYLLNLREEKIGSMADLAAAQNVSKLVVKHGAYEDLLSVDAMSAYYVKFYAERKEELSYNADDIGAATDLVDLLSLSSVRSGLARLDGDRPFHAQAFRTAGERFQVIDDNTASVIVPDNDEAIGLISKLRSESFEWEVTRLLRTAQKYTVEIFPAVEKKLLEKRAMELLPCGAYVLDEAFYDKKIGIIPEGKPMDPLVF